MSPDPSREPESVLVSACLLGRECRYDGGANHDRALERRLAAEDLEPLPFCPEEQGGLGTPRPPAWIDKHDAGAVVDGLDTVRRADGEDVGEAFLKGARGALKLCLERGVRRAFLKERSPSCGVCQTHVDGRLVEGPGVTTEFLRRAGIEVEGVEGRRG